MLQQTIEKKLLLSIKLNDEHQLLKLASAKSDMGGWTPHDVSNDSPFLASKSQLTQL
jgi:hypothetical protein